MAGNPRLTPRAATRLALLAAVVLAVHALALNWLARQLEDQASILQPMAKPMFTRLLKPEAPAAVVAVSTATVPPRRARRSGITALPEAVATGPSSPASAPKLPPELVSDTEMGPITANPMAAPDNATVAAQQQQPQPADPALAAPSPSASAAAAALPAASAASAPAAPTLDSWPVDTRLSYQLSGHFRGELYGSAKVQWQRQEERYQTRVDIDITLFASLALTSQGEVTPAGLVPRAYEEMRRSGPRVARLDDATIKLNDGRVVPRPAGVQDTASQFVELSHRFANGLETLEVGRSVNLWLARPGGVDLWTYDIVEREMLRTPKLGTVEAFHLKPRPIPNTRGNITAEMWFAPTLQYLPVRIRVNMGEATYVDLMVEKIEQR